MKTKIVYYTDGACSGNGKEDAIGGWAWALVKNGRFECLDSDRLTEQGTTNNIAELTAIVRALQHAVGEGYENITIISDSAYCINGATEWMFNWARNGWYRDKAQTKEVKNEELWRELYTLTTKVVSVTWKKVAGHSGDFYNEKVDLEAKKRTEEAKWKKESLM